MADIRRSDLRDFMVLTIQTTEITARTSDGQTRRTWMEMIQRFFLDRVDGQRTGHAIDLADQYTIVIPATATKARFTIGDMAMVWTEQTLHLIPV